MQITHKSYLNQAINQHIYLIHVKNREQNMNTYAYSTNVYEFYLLSIIYLNNQDFSLQLIIFRFCSNSI
jgi:hypothetical protein